MSYQLKIRGEQAPSILYLPDDSLFTTMGFMFATKMQGSTGLVKTLRNYLERGWKLGHYDPGSTMRSASRSASIYPQVRNGCWATPS